MLAASAGMQQQAAATQQKFMYVPQMPAAAAPQHMQQAAAASYMQPTLFQDQSGKTYVLNGQQPQHPAFQLAQQVPGKSPLVCNIVVFSISKSSRSKKLFNLRSLSLSTFNALIVHICLHLA